uniref:Ubiquitin thioesterase OTU n=1 Tax=Blastobotrys adeninivorans TaxID=409370 RepID=A0A060T623_BLAAD
MRIKVRGASGAQVLSLDDGATVADLMDKIGTVQELRGGGFPPKKLDLSNSSATLKELGVANGDQLTVVESSHGQQTSQSAPAPSTRPSQTVQSQPRSAAGAGGGGGGGASDQDVPTVPVGSGYLTLRVMEDDNSCLFASIAYAITGTVNNMFEMRTAVAEGIRNDPVEYNDAILGRPRDEYVQWILRESSWGGAIELNILSKTFGVTIQCMDVATGTVHTFNPGMDNFIAVMYSGIHYDAVVLEGGSETQTVFEGDETGFAVMEALNALQEKLKQKHYYTDTASFQVKCNDCGTILTGEKKATEHAKATGHTNFGEV